MTREENITKIYDRLIKMKAMQNYDHDELDLMETTLRNLDQNHPYFLYDKPIMLLEEQRSFEKLRKLAKDYINFVFSKEYSIDHNFDRMMFEQTVEAFYGHDVFDKINKRDG